MCQKDLLKDSLGGLRWLALKSKDLLLTSRRLVYALVSFVSCDALHISLGWS